MKRLMFLMPILLSCFSIAFAQEVTFSLSDGEGYPGETDIEIEFSITNSVDLAGFQTRITYDSNLLVVASVTASERLDDPSDLIVTYPASGMVSLLALDLSGNRVLAEGQGAVVIMVFNISSSAIPDTTTNLLLSNSDATDLENSTSLPVVEINGSITILQNEALIFGDVSAVCQNNRVRLKWDLLSPEKYSGCHVYRSGTGDSWQQLTTSLLISATDYSFLDHEIIAGTSYLYKISVINRQGVPVAARQIKVDTINSAQSLVLQPVWPNPTAGLCSISFYLPQSSQVIVQLYSISGRNLAAIMDRNMPPGQHHFTWNGSTLPSGTYFIRLQTDFGADNQRITVVR